jgi:hypothetical protein
LNRARRLRALAVAACAAVAVAACAAAGVAAAAAPAAGAGVPAPRIKVLSNRADLVSGGDAFVRVTLPRGVRASRLRLSAGRRNVTRVLHRTGRRRLEGVVRRLPVGRVPLVARIRRAGAARLFVINHPIGGPVFAGPQIQPWTCQDGAKDAKCNQAPSYRFLYLPKGAPTDGATLPGTNTNGSGGPFQPYDPSSPPPAGSIATTTTTDGVTAPFIVRLETGYIDRDQYAIATLFDPGEPWTPTAPQRQFNRRMVITHGFSCDTAYETGDAPSVLQPKLVGGGFVVVAHALDHAGHNCNLLTQAESLVMTKEYVVDHYGTVRWTIGSGCSGGSLVQHQVANAYPGVYQGLTPQCSFPDAWSSAMQYEEYFFGLKYLENPTRWGLGVIYDPVATTAFFDHPNPANPVTFTTAIPNSGEPSRSCPGVPADQVYDEQTNPHGVRCTLQDYMVNAFGRDDRGFARRGFDNVGVQYGLKGLRQGRISPAQFVDFNSHIGGADLDLTLTPERTVADPIALERLYRTGAISAANNLNRVAIIELRDSRQPDPLARAGGADRRPLVRRRLRLRDGPLAGPRSRRPPQGSAGTKDHRGQAGHGRPPLHRRTRARASVRGVRPDGVLLWHAAPGRRRSSHGGRDEVPAQGDAPRRLPRDLHRRPVAAAPAGLPRWGLRLRQAGHQPARRGPVADLPGQARARDLRRQAAGSPTGLPGSEPLDA